MSIENESAYQVKSDVLSNLALAEKDSNEVVLARKAKASIKIALERITAAVAAYDNIDQNYTDKALLASDLDNASKYCDSLRKQLKILRSTVSIRNRTKAVDSKQAELPMAPPVIESIPLA